MTKGGESCTPLDAAADSVRAEPTLASIFVRRCGEQPDRLAYAFVRDTLEPAESVTYGELYQQVCRLGRQLARHSESGDRVLLVYPPGIDFVRAFWACILTGRIAVPVPAPDAARFKNSAPRLQAIMRDASARLLLTTEDMVAAAGSMLDESAVAPRAVLATKLSVLSSSDADDECTREVALPVQPDMVAYLQYTSGSTASPRGVMLTHRNLIAQCQHGVAVLAMTSASRILSWLPHHHDYGLVLGVIWPLYAMAPAYLMSSLTFLRRPLRWLDAIGRFGITHTGGPNFAYAACVRAANQQVNWQGNLSTLRSLSCGAEPIRAQTLDAFASVFAPYGLPSRVLMPSYGMAETVLGITTIPLGGAFRVATVAADALARNQVKRLPAGAAGVVSIVGCGYPIEGMMLAIVDPDTRQLSDMDAVGEVWVRGNCVGKGYWQQAEATEATFHACLATGDGPWLRTGDLGFLQQGELFITGRRKDLIIVRGRNLYPQDLEWSAQRVDPLLRPGYGAAFSVDGEDGEEAVIVQELERKEPGRDLRAIAASIRRAIADEYELTLKSVVLVRSGTLPRTSSGKIRRHRCRQDYLGGALQALLLDDGSANAYEYEAPIGATETTLASVWSEVLRRDVVGRRDRFIDLGGHSLLATQMASRVRMRFGVEVPLAMVFEQATLADMAAEIDRLGAAGNLSSAPGAISIAKVERSGPVPVSFSQRRMWLVQQINPETTAYNMPFVFRIACPVDPDLMAVAVDRVARHHEAFRTRFELVDGEPMQCIEEHHTVELEFLALDDLPANVRDERARDLLRERIQRRFDLSRLPLHRPTLLRLGECDYVFLWAIHHAVGDLWSFGVLLRDLSLAYDALRAGRDVSLSRQHIEYADYAVWQRDPARLPELERQMGYWRRRLEGLQPITLPADLQRRSVPTGRGGRVSVLLSPEIVAAIKQFSRLRGVSPFMTLFGCFTVLLARYCAQDDVAVGVPIANRHRFESEHLVGTLVNTLVMRTDLAGNPSFSELLGRVRERVLEAYANQDASFEELVEELTVGRNFSISPLVDVMFNVINAPFDTLTLAGKPITRFDVDRGASQFDLAVTVDTEVFGQVHLEYAADLFVPASAERMLRSYLFLVEQVLADPDLSIHAYSLLPAAERAELERLNATRRHYPDASCIHDRLSAQAASTPDSIALFEPGKGQLTYRELESRSNRLAHALRARGVGPGALVGLCVERGLDMVVAQLAILKSGAAYVPLDPAYPADRLAYMAEDARLALLVTEAALMQALAWPRAQSLWLDADSAAIAAQPDTALPPAATLDARPEAPAYVIYTSGSTGKPKGVVVHHRAVVNFLSSMAREPGLSANDTLVAVTTLSFDIAVLELLLPLSVGARVVLASRDQAMDGVALRELIESNRATVMQATPSTWRILIESGWQGSPAFKALIGGEGLPQDLAAQLMARTGELWNMYGPTETTVWSTCWKVVQPENGISIGRPIANTSVHILDERLQDCPIGVPGEIYIGGDGVSLGYLNQTELTAERFISDPFRAGGRLYRTGDRGRWRHDGLLDHMGRLDFQVKVRGYRIELGEIETNLAAHPRVARAVVIVREDVSGDARLVAYVVARDGMPEVQALRDHLRASLPEYMIPQFFVEIDAIPLLPNGKIDRRGLPVPTEQGGISRDLVEPSSEAELAVAAVWKRLLDISQVGVTDNFFDLGGHSLLAMRAVTELNQQFGAKVGVRQLIFESLGQIAASITAIEVSAASTADDTADDTATDVGAGAAKRWRRKLAAKFR